MSAETLQPTEVAAPRWASGLKRLAVIVGAIVVLLGVLRPLVNDPPQKGERGSSFATVEGGVAALADLAARYNYPLLRRTTPLDQSAAFDRYPLAPDSVLVVLEAELSTDDAVDVGQFIRTGGHVVASVGPGVPWTSELVDVESTEAFAISSTGVSVTATTTSDTLGNASVSSETYEAKDLRVDGTKALRVEQLAALGLESKVIAVRDGLPIAATISLGEGQITLVSDSSMFTNALLDKADNASFSLEVLGNGTRTIVFAEEPHGFGSSLSPTGLPSNVRGFLWGLVAATIVLMISRSKRNGPPEQAHRDLAPPRSLYLASMAASLDKVERGPRRFGRVSRSAQPLVPPSASPPETVTPDRSEIR